MKCWLVTILFLVLSCQTTAKQPVASDPIDPKFWVDFQQEWIEMDVDHYRLYVFHNR